MTASVTGVWFGNLPYDDALALQLAWVEDRIADKVGDTILFGEHPPVITMGRGGHPENLLNLGDIPVVNISRGGDVTYHGPGQLMIYPILKLNETERDLHHLLRQLEDGLLQGLLQFEITGHRTPGLTGVWIDQRKVASIGIAIKRWVTYHGVALNVTTPADAFSMIQPCGLDSTVMAALSDFAPGVQTQPFEPMAAALLPFLAKALNREAEPSLRTISEFPMSTV